MPYARVWSSIADSRSATATPMWSMRPNTAASVSSCRVRLAVVANVKSRRGLDPAWLAKLLGGAEVFGLDELSRIADVDRIVVSGGDGTIAPVAERAGALGVPLAVIAAGTANDFARANGLPSDPRAAAELAAGGTTLRRLELGRLSSGRPFVNVAGAGLSSGAGRRGQPLKSRFGPFA